MIIFNVNQYQKIKIYKINGGQQRGCGEIFIERRGACVCKIKKVKYIHHINMNFGIKYQYLVYFKYLHVCIQITLSP